MFVQAGVELLDIQQRLLIHKLQELLGLFRHLEENIQEFIFRSVKRTIDIQEIILKRLLSMFVMDVVGFKRLTKAHAFVQIRQDLTCSFVRFRHAL